MFKGKRLKTIRKKERMSVAKLSYLMNTKGVSVTERSIYNWEAESCEPSVASVYCLASIFNKEPAFFLSKNYVKSL